MGAKPSVRLFVLAALLLRRQFLHHLVEVEARGLLPDREFLKAREPLPDHRLRRHDEEHALRHPFAVFERLSAPLEWVGTEVVDIRCPEVGEVPLPDVEARVHLLLEGDLPLVDTQGDQLAIVAPVEEFFAWRFLHLAFEERHQVVAVEVDLERLVSRLAALLAPFHHIRIAAGCGEGRDEIFMREHVVVHGARLDHPGPADHRRHAEAAFPVGRLLTAERGAATIGPAHDLGPVVGGVDDDGVVRDAQVVEFLQQLAHVPVVLDHAVGVDAEAGLPLRFLLEVRKHVHARAVEIARRRASRPCAGGR